eukprot:Gb_41344 [translate_table: standard]
MENGGKPPPRIPPNPPFNSYASPSLYATPLETKTSSSPPSSFAPSPYVVNHKRRGPHLHNKNEPNFLQNGSLLTLQTDLDRNGANKENCLIENMELRNVHRAHENLKEDTGKLVTGDHSSNLVAESPFVNIRELDVSIRKSSAEDMNKEGIELQSAKDEFSEIDSKFVPPGSTDTEDRVLKSPQLQAMRAASGKEFYDALDDLCGEDERLKTPSCISPRVNDEFDTLMSTLHIETERRVQAEETLAIWQNQWYKIAQKFSLAGLYLPSVGTDFHTEAETVNDADPIDQYRDQLAIARLVAGAIARGIATAELEEEIDSLIENKNREIARLRDKLQYYELVNHEMSQRNQEAIESARRHRKRQQKRQKWFWRSVVLGATLGATALSYSYFPWNKIKDWKPSFETQMYHKMSTIDSGRE